MVNEEAQVSRTDGLSTNNPQTTASAFNKYFLSLVEKSVNDDNDDDGSGDNSNRYNNNNNNNNNNILQYIIS